MSSQQLVSVVVLNWNGLEDTKRCLHSIREQTYKNLEIVVVDNGSEDGSKEYLKKKKDIVFVDLDKNYGFTGGHIKGYEAAHGHYLAIVNNDLVLDKHWVKTALEVMLGHKSSAVVGGKLFKWNDDNPVGNKANEFFTYQEVNPRTGYTRTLLTGEEECPVDSISGAALLIDVSAVKKVGYFDDEFFAYYAETDLIARLLRAGYKAVYTPKAMAWHKVAGSSERVEESYFYLYMMHRNRYLFAVKNLDKRYLGIFLRNYFHEYIRAIIGSIFQPTTERKAQIKAYTWNKKHHLLTMQKRRNVLKLGRSYVDKLGENKPQDVTVVIPCYNYAQYITQAVDSVLAQTVLPTRIIILNDGSTDNSMKVLERYKKHRLVEVIDKSNEGVIKTKNRGLKMTTSNWILFFDADDLMTPNYIKELLLVATTTRSDVIYSDMKYFGSDTSAIFVARSFSLLRLIRRNFIHNSALIKTSLVKMVGGYKPEMEDGLEDWELYLSLAEAGARFSYLPLPLFLYRQHDSALSRNAAVVQKEKELYELILSFHPKLRKYASRPRRWAVLLAKGAYNIIIHPGLILVLFTALPKATMNFLGTFVYEMRAKRDRLVQAAEEKMRYEPKED